MKIDYLWLFIGLALGYLVLPMVLGAVKGKATRKAS